MRLSIVVSPKAARNAVLGWKVDATGQRELAVSVTAAPESGKATKAACEAVAAAVGLPKSKVSCARGATSRHKQLELDGDEAAIMQTLESLPLL